MWLRNKRRIRILVIMREQKTLTKQRIKNLNQATMWLIRT